jgi:hypothetical protein
MRPEDVEPNSRSGWILGSPNWRKPFLSLFNLCLVTGVPTGIAGTALILMQVVGWLKTGASTPMPILPDGLETGYHAIDQAIAFILNQFSFCGALLGIATGMLITGASFLLIHVSRDARRPSALTR